MYEMGEKVAGYVSGAKAHEAIHCLRCVTDGALNIEQEVMVVFEVSGEQETRPGGRSAASCPGVRNCRATTHRMDESVRSKVI